MLVKHHSTVLNDTLDPTERRVVQSIPCPPKVKERSSLTRRSLSYLYAITSLISPLAMQLMVATSFLLLFIRCLKSRALSFGVVFNYMLRAVARFLAVDFLGVLSAPSQPSFFCVDIGY